MISHRRVGRYTNVGTSLLVGGAALSSTVPRSMDPDAAAKSKAQLAAESKAKLAASLQDHEIKLGDEDALARYREQTLLNKPKDGKRKTLMERQSEVGNSGEDAFKMSERIIVNTQKTTDSLRRRRKLCQDTIDSCAAQIATLDAEIAEFESKLARVNAGWTIRCADRDRCRATLDSSIKQRDALMNECGGWVAKNRIEEDRAYRKLAKQNLQAGRGYNADPGSTYTAKQARALINKLQTAQRDAKGKGPHPAGIIPDGARVSAAVASAFGGTGTASAATFGGTGTMRPSTTGGMKASRSAPGL